jgi:hypothetical protein
VAPTPLGYPWAPSLRVLCRWVLGRVYKPPKDVNDVYENFVEFRKLEKLQIKKLRLFGKEND